MTFYC